MCTVSWGIVFGHCSVSFLHEVNDERLCMMYDIMLTNLRGRETIKWAGKMTRKEI